MLLPLGRGRGLPRPYCAMYLYCPVGRGDPTPPRKLAVGTNLPFACRGEHCSPVHFYPIYRNIRAAARAAYMPPLRMTCYIVVPAKPRAGQCPAPTVQWFLLPHSPVMVCRSRQVCRGRIYASRAVYPIYRNNRAGKPSPQGGSHTRGLPANFAFSPTNQKALPHSLRSAAAPVSFALSRKQITAQRST